MDSNKRSYHSPCRSSSHQNAYISTTGGSRYAPRTAERVHNGPRSPTSHSGGVYASPSETVTERSRQSTREDRDYRETRRSSRSYEPQDVYADRRRTDARPAAAARDRLEQDRTGSQSRQGSSSSYQGTYDQRQTRPASTGNETENTYDYRHVEDASVKLQNVMLDGLPIHVTVSANKLLRILNVQTALREDAVEARDFAIASQSQHTRFSGAFCSSKFQDWISDYRSSTLVVHGKDPGSDTEKFSGLSAYAYALLAWVRSSGFGLPMGFFCGLHQLSDESDDPLSGGRGLFRAMIQQLLYCKDDADIVMSKHDFRGFEDGDITETCFIFEDLLRITGKSRGMIVCVIDGAHVLDSSKPLRPDFAKFVLSMNEMMKELEQSGSQVTLKLLLLFPTTSVKTHRWVRDHNLGGVMEVEEESYYRPCNDSSRLIGALDRLEKDPGRTGRPKRPGCVGSD